MSFSEADGKLTLKIPKLDDEQKLARDVASIQQISIIPSLLDVICRFTGMGFAAVARVTHDRWIACSVKDEINFGLKPGGELQVETTICNEIRDHHRPVVIDHVKESDFYNHHTPLKYGFQSYISIPIMKKNGEFFGTLCAIDPKPALINNTETINTFKLFAELISFHLDSIDVMERNNSAVLELNKQLTESTQENRQYQYISNHNLQEPLRKLRLFSDILILSLENNELERAKNLALKINTSAQRFSMMIQDLSDFKSLNQDGFSFEPVDLNTIAKEVFKQLSLPLETVHAEVKLENLPTINAVTIQMEQLFFHLVNNAIKFCRKDTPLQLRIFSNRPDPETIEINNPGANGKQYVEVGIEDNGIGIDKLHLEKIFDIFSKMESDPLMKAEGIGLAYCRKIVRNHQGSITARSELGLGTTFTILLPIN